MPRFTRAQLQVRRFESEYLAVCLRAEAENDRVARVFAHPQRGSRIEVCAFWRMVSRARTSAV